jgi:hypothetical protein
MRNLRTGRVASYDAELVAAGTWEEVISKQEKPKSPTQDEVAVKDEVKITITRGKAKSKD